MVLDPRLVQGTRLTAFDLNPQFTSELIGAISAGMNIRQRREELEFEKMKQNAANQREEMAMALEAIKQASAMNVDMNELAKTQPNLFVKAGLGQFIPQIPKSLEQLEAAELQKISPEERQNLILGGLRGRAGAVTPRDIFGARKDIGGQALSMGLDPSTFSINEMGNVITPPSFEKVISQSFQGQQLDIARKEVQARADQVAAMKDDNAIKAFSTIAGNFVAKPDVDPKEYADAVYRSSVALAQGKIPSGEDYNKFQSVAQMQALAEARSKLSAQTQGMLQFSMALMKSEKAIESFGTHQAATIFHNTLATIQNETGSIVPGVTPTGPQGTVTGDDVARALANTKVADEIAALIGSKIQLTDEEMTSIRNNMSKMPSSSRALKAGQYTSQRLSKAFSRSREKLIPDIRSSIEVGSPTSSVSDEIQTLSVRARGEGMKEDDIMDYQAIILSLIMKDPQAISDAGVGRGMDLDIAVRNAITQFENDINKLRTSKRGNK